MNRRSPSSSSCRDKFLTPPWRTSWHQPQHCERIWPDDIIERHAGLIQLSFDRGHVRRCIKRITRLQVWPGEHDFTAFAASGEKDALVASKVRTVFDSRAWLDGDRLLYRVRGSGFLKHMVRNLVGTLIEAGKGNLDEARIRALLAPNVQVKGGPTVQARGLFLLNVEY